MRQLIKFIFVIVMPVSMAIFTVGTLVSTDYSPTSKLMLVIFTLFTILQALMWVVYMNKIKMMPKMSKDFYFGFGLAFGFKDRQAFLTVPFVVLSFDWRTRVKKGEGYGY